MPQVIVGAFLAIEAAGAAIATAVGIGMWGAAVAGLALATGVALTAGYMLLQTVVGLFSPKSPTPQAAETQLKTPTPVRVYGYGRRRIYGAVILFETAATGEAIDVVAYVDGRAHAVHAVYLNDDAVTLSSGVVAELTDGAYRRNKVLAGYNLGLSTETAFSAVTALLPGIWTSTHRGDGIVTGYLIKKPTNSEDFLTVYPNGDNIQMSLVLDMQYLFDPRDGTMSYADPATWVKVSPLLDNPVLVLLHYLTVRRGVDYTTRILPQIDKWIAAANICDETVALDIGGNRRRYTCDILYDSSAKPAEVIASILETFDGWYNENADREFVVYAGKYYTPTVNIDESQIIDYSHQAFVEEENIINEISVKYYSDDHDYNQVDAQPWRDEADISARGATNSSTFAPQTRSYRQARALAKVQMSRTNASDRGRCKTKFSGRAVMNERFVNLSIIEAGTIYSGPVEITSLERDPDTGGIIFDWVKVDTARYDWTPSSDDGYGAPAGDHVVLAPLDDPVITDATIETDAPSSTYRVRITGTGPDRTDLTWFLRWRPESTTSWNETSYSDTTAGVGVELLSNAIPLTTTVDIEIAYKMGDGRISNWVAVLIPPAGFLFLTDADGAYLTDGDGAYLVETV